VAREVAGGLGPAGQGRVFLVPASEQAQDVSEVLRSGHDTQVLHDGLQALGASLRLDALLADAPAGLTETSLSVMAISQAVLVLLRPDQRDYQGTGVLIDVARKLNVPDVELVVSQVPGGYDPAQVRATVERAYGCRVAALLPLVSDVPLSAPGAVFAVARQQHRWSQSVAQLAERLAPPPGERSPASRGHAETQESR
jgi:MinD-like ATPase involved in chromosome partitioning or flagellar assembly